MLRNMKCAEMIVEVMEENKFFGLNFSALRFWMKNSLAG